MKDDMTEYLERPRNPGADDNKCALCQKGMDPNTVDSPHALARRLEHAVDRAVSRHNLLTPTGEEVVDLFQVEVEVEYK